MKRIGDVKKVSKIKKKREALRRTWNYIMLKQNDGIHSGLFENMNENTPNNFRFLLMNSFDE